jgi:hypothetical protein
MRLRTILITAVALAAVLSVPLADAKKPCVKKGCRVAYGIYESATLLLNVHTTYKPKLVTLGEPLDAPSALHGTCKNAQGTKPDREKPDANAPWQFKGGAPIIGRVVTYNGKSVFREGKHSTTEKVTLKVHMLTARKGRLSVVYHEVDAGSDSGGFTCTAKASATVKR